MLYPELLMLNKLHKNAVTCGFSRKKTDFWSFKRFISEHFCDITYPLFYA